MTDAPKLAKHPPAAQSLPKGGAKGNVALHADSRRQLLVLGAAIAGTIALAVWATVAAPGEDAPHYGALAMVPAVVAIVLAFATRQVLLALFAGIFSGGLVYAFGSGVALSNWGDFAWDKLNVVDTFILEALGTRDYAVILFVYLWCLGGLIGLWGRTGGAQHFAVRIAGLVRGPRSAKLVTWILALIFHQGGIVSTLLAGTTSRPVLDRHPVAKEEAAYIIDSTATSAATLIPFNVWPIVIAGAIGSSIPFFTNPDGTADIAKASAFYFQALPFHFYGLLAVSFTFLMAVGWLPLVGGMKKARQRVESGGDLVRPGSNPLSPKELSHDQKEPGYRTGLPDFVLPLAFLIVISIGPFLIMMALGKPASTYIIEAFFTALVVGILVAVAKGMPVRTALDGVLTGAKGVTIAAIILGLAFTLKVVGDALGTGPFMASLIGGVTPGILPAILMVVAMVIAFSTGTSFGTFAVLFPVAMPLADAALPGSETLLAMCFAAVVGGSIFGDQASPISDTTVLSSVTAGCDLMDHVTTQIPYAATAAGLALVGYVVLGLTMF